MRRLFGAAVRRERGGGCGACSVARGGSVAASDESGSDATAGGDGVGVRSLAGALDGAASEAGAEASERGSKLPVAQKTSAVAMTTAGIHTATNVKN